MTVATQHGLKTDSSKIESLAAHLQLVAVIDHSRAGNMFFMRLFDQHPEVLVIPQVGYIFHDMGYLFAGREKVKGHEARVYLATHSNFMLVANEPDELIRASFRKHGDDLDAPLDRKKVRDSLEFLLPDDGNFSKREIILAMHIAYAEGRGINLQSVRYLLVNDSVDGHNDNPLLETIRENFSQAKIIHLVRDPRACFASLRHQYTNSYGSLYPVHRRQISRAVGCSSVWLWIFADTLDGAQTMLNWESRSTKDNFKRVRIEDINTKFQPTMQDIVQWLGVAFFEGWQHPEYVVTSIGKPWRGISAYRNHYQPNTKGPIQNEDEKQVTLKFARPNAQVVNNWRRHVLPHEIPLLETVYQHEMQIFGYPRDQDTAEIKIWKPLLGEFPPVQWLFGLRAGRRLKDFLIKYSYCFLLPYHYVRSRMQFKKMHKAKRFTLNTTNQIQ